MRLSILLLTYDRKEYAVRTIRELFRFMRPPADAHVHLHIADDGSPGDYIDELVMLATAYSIDFQWPLSEITTSNASRSGYGASYNLATQIVHDRADAVLVLEDDWELREEIRIQEWLDVLEQEPWVNAVRFGYMGWTQDVRCDLKYLNGSLTLHILPESAERHVNSGHPRLERVSYQRSVGPWAEGIGAGATEFDWCGREESRHGVVYPFLRPGGAFAHIGTVLARDD